ncbi:hypothetical protein J6350_10585 [Burkholderia pseudomallei]|uniref:hypothetical protein n=1 Tax=Burkholderia pseudomallei TaxID=28450 RepID=UPI001AAE4113|nr:hypothetical protein [Burkholderia pseudomallei]MBO3034771.1 hypothetical protein [Burkholderia pseudomallei]MBO7845577.1 hypothetical protein [Burkholderia pseudomallei]
MIVDRRTRDINRYQSHLQQGETYYQQRDVPIRSGELGNQLGNRLADDKGSDFVGVHARGTADSRPQLVCGTRSDSWLAFSERGIATGTQRLVSTFISVGMTVFENVVPHKN